MCRSGNAPGPWLASRTAVQFVRNSPSWLAAIVAAVLVMCVGARAADAMVCHGERSDEDEPMVSMLSEYRVQTTAKSPQEPKVDAPANEGRALYCDALSGERCDMGVPEGAPQPSERFDPHPSGVALVPSKLRVGSTPSQRALRQWHLLSANSSEYLRRIDRPPQRS